MAEGMIVKDKKDGATRHLLISTNEFPDSAPAHGSFFEQRHWERQIRATNDKQDDAVGETTISELGH